MYNNNFNQRGIVVAVSLSQGGVPKLPQESVLIDAGGIVGDLHAHAKHNKPTRALNLFDEEIMQELRDEGYHLLPGTIGENILLRDVDVQNMSPGTLLKLGNVVVRLEEPRKPCYVLDVIDNRLKEVIIGRCGYMASVLQGGSLQPGAKVECLEQGRPESLAEIAGEAKR